MFEQIQPSCSHKGVKRQSEEHTKEMKRLCKNLTVVLDKSAPDHFKCNTCCKYFASVSALESHIQARHTVTPKLEVSEHDCNFVNNVNKNIRVYKKLCVKNSCEMVNKNDDICQRDKKVTEHVSLADPISRCSSSSSTTHDKLMETINNTESASSDSTQNIVVKQEILDHDISDLDILIPKIELQVCDTEFNTNLQNSDSVNETVDRLGYRCPFCNYTTTYKTIFQRHVRLSDVQCYEILSNDTLVVGSYYCSICKTKFSTEAIFEHHMQTHKLNSCEVCNYVCSYECELIRHQHLKYHNMYRFQCYVCYEYFNTYNMLKEHFSCRHVDADIKLMCQICKATFSTMNDMSNHCDVEFTYGMDINLEDGIFRHIKLNCNPCDKNTYNEESSLIQIGVKKLNKFYCCSCDNQYSSIYYLNQHFISSHIIYTSKENNEVISIDSCNSSVCKDSNSLITPIVCGKPEDSILPVPYENNELFPNLNCTGEPELIVPDILDHEVNNLPYVPIQTNQESVLQNKKDLIPKVLKKQNKIKTMQVKVNNTKSHICSVNMQSSSNQSSKQADNSLKTFFVNNSNNNNSESHESPKEVHASIDPSVYSSVRYEFWCNLCQCSFNSNHDEHSESRTLKCQKCSFQSPSLETLISHFTSVHINSTYEKKSSVFFKSTAKSCCRKDVIGKCQPGAKNCTNSCATDSYENFVSMLKISNKYCLEHFFFRCPLCDTVFNKYETYVDHFSIHIRQKPIFKCVICKINFDKYSYSVQHFKEHLQSKVHCISCCQDIQTNVFFNGHECVDNHCSFCSYEVEDVTELCEHSQSHVIVNKSVFKCTLCKFYFFTRYNFDKHLSNVHSNSGILV